MAGGDDDLTIHGSLDGTLDRDLRELEQRLDAVDRKLSEVGRTGEESGSDVAKGADKATAGLGRMDSAAEGAAGSVDQVDRSAKRATNSVSAFAREAGKVRDRTRELSEAAKAAASALDDAGEDAASAGAAMAGAAKGADKLGDELADTAVSAKAAGAALDDAGDEAATAGAKAATSATLWSRLADRMARMERASRLVARAQSLMRWDTYKAQIDRVTAAGQRFAAVPWDKSAKKLDTLAKAFGGLGKVMMVGKFVAIGGAVWALLGAISALGAGAIGMVGGLGNMAAGLTAVLPVAFSLILAMKGVTAAMKECEPETKALKEQFQGFTTNIASGGLREGLQGLVRDTKQLSGLTNTLGTYIGRSAKATLDMAGAYLKSEWFLQRFGVIADGVRTQLTDLGLTGVSALRALVAVMAGASPVASRLTQDVHRLMTGFENNLDGLYESGRMTEYLDRAYTNLTRGIGVLADWVVGLYNIFKIGAEESRWMADSIEESASRFRVWTQDAEGQNSIRQYFQDAMPAVRETGLLLRDLIYGLGGMATGANIAPLLNQIRTQLLPALLLLASAITGEILPGLVELATNLAKLFAGLDFSGFALLLAGLNAFLEGVLWASENVPGFNFVLSSLLTILFLLGPAFWVFARGAKLMDGLTKGAGWLRVALTGVAAEGKKLTLVQRVFHGIASGIGRLGKLIGGGLWGALRWVATGVTWLGGLLKGPLVQAAMWAGRMLAAAFLGSNPIGWIILGVTAAVAAFLWLWNNCQWFRDAVMTALSAVGNFFVWLGGIIWGALQAIGGWFSWLWTVAIWPVLSAIVTGFKWLIAIVFTIVVAPFVLLFHILAAVFTWWWQNVTLPVLTAVGNFFVWIFQNVILPVVNFFIAVWNASMAFLAFAYYTYVVPMLSALGAFFSWIFGVIVMGVVNFFVGAWNLALAAIAWAYYTLIVPFLAAMGAMFNWIIGNVIMPVVNFLWMAWNMAMLGLQLAYLIYIVPMLNAFGAILNWLWLNVATPVINGILWLWNALYAGISWVWYNLIQPVFSAVGTGLDIMRGWFQSAVDGIIALWNGLRAGLAAPVNFIIGTVWNRGILPAWNWVAEKLGLPLGAPMAEIPAFAAGGGIRGAGTGTSDDIIARVSNGEHVWTAKEVRKAGGHQNVEKLRRMVVTDSLPLYATGGPVTPQEMHSVANAAVPGTRLTSAYRAGDSGWHGKNRAADLAGPRSMDTPHMNRLNSFIAGKFGNSTQLIYTPGVNLLNGRHHTYNAATRAGHHDHVHWVNNGNGEGDSGGGGWLAQTLWQIGKPILDGILDPIINGIPFNGPPQFLDMPKALARKGKDEFYRWAEEKLGAISVGGGDAAPGSGPVFDQVKAVADRWGWGPGSNQWNDLSALISKESSWNPTAQNPTSTAYGLFQFLNGTWGTVGGKKTPNPGEQTEYGLRYIRQKYRDPVGAWGFHRANGWYDNGGYLPPGPSLVMNGTGQPEPVFTAGQWDILASNALLNPDALVSRMLATPQTSAALEASGRDAELDYLAASVDALAGALAERPPAFAVNGGEDTKRAVADALREHERAKAQRDRYRY